MKTRINLYRDEFKPKFVWMSANNTIVFGLIALIVMGAIYFAAWQDLQTQQKALVAMQKSIASKQADLGELTKQLTQRTTDPVLLAKLKNQQIKLSTGQRLANKLDGLSELQERPFSSAFNSLAQSNDTSVWLTSLTVNDQRILIKGNISEPSALPTWLKSIGKTDFFNNRDFGAATVYRTNEQLSFSIESQEHSETKATEATNE